MACQDWPSSNGVRIVAESPAPYSGKGDQPPIPERLLARLWQRRAARQQGFRTDRGLRVRVLYPGRPGKAAGPDFRNALLEIEGMGLVQGDVEIHRRQGDWEAHGHRNDPNYNRVVLHAALEIDSSTTQVASGQPISVISLAPLLGELPAGLPEGQLGEAFPGGQLWGLLASLGYSRPTSAAEMGALLDRAGDARFLNKSGGFQKFLREQGPQQTLYEALLEALGYQHNQQPFLVLAHRAPYRTLERAVRELPQEQWAEHIESWLLKLSGLLSEDDAASIALPGAGFGQAMSGREWRCFRVRPANHPRRRISGAARLLARFLGVGLVGRLSAHAMAGSPKELTIALTIDNGFTSGSAFIGPPRAKDLAVNVALPFLHGLATSAGEAAQAQQYLKLYHQFGKLQENELTREMADQLMESPWVKEVTTARRQQGLIHLQRLLAGATS